MDISKAKRLALKILVLVVIVAAFLIFNIIITNNRLESFVYTEDNNSYAYQIESISVEDKELVIRGWFFQLKKVRNSGKYVNKNAKTGIVLYDLNSNIEKSVEVDSTLEGISCSVKTVERNDINEYFKCEFDYSGSGFVAKTSVNNLDLENGLYQIVIKPDDVGTNGIDTNSYIDHNILKYVDPREYIELDVKGTDLETVVENGFCLAYDKDYHVCVYQYDNKIYWIVSDEYYFENDGDTQIQYQLDTTQFENLPKSRIDKGSYWDFLSDAFEKHEITESFNCGKYRVCVRAIPAEYAVTNIITGYYTDGNWIWNKILRPCFLYKND